MFYYHIFVFIMSYNVAVYAIVVIVSITVVGTGIHLFISNYYGKSIAREAVEIPLKFISALVIVSVVLSLAQSHERDVRSRELAIRNGLSDFTQSVNQVAVKRLLQYQDDIGDVYKNIYNLDRNSASEKYFKQRCKRLKIPYITYSDNPRAWIISTSYLQDVVNVVRKFELMKEFPLSKKGKGKLLTSPFAGWISYFRKLFGEPTVRNVWERNRFTYMTPEFNAWIDFYVIAYVNQKGYATKHRKQWNINVQRVKKNAKLI